MGGGPYFYAVNCERNEYAAGRFAFTAAVFCGYEACFAEVFGVDVDDVAGVVIGKNVEDYSASFACYVLLIVQ
jgi:hypothetical protein